MIRLLHQKQTDLNLHCLSMPFLVGSKCSKFENVNYLLFGIQNMCLSLKMKKKNHNCKLKFCLPVSGPVIKMNAIGNSEGGDFFWLEVFLSF